MAGLGGVFSGYQESGIFLRRKPTGCRAIEVNAGEADSMLGQARFYEENGV